jgi:hypothetical protein
VLPVQRQQEVDNAEPEIAEGLEIVKEMLKKADIMAENMAPRTIERRPRYESVKTTPASSTARSRASAPAARTRRGWPST